MAAAVAGVVLVVLVGCSGAESKKIMTEELWRRDLRHLEKELVKRHAEPFKAVEEEAFRQAVRRLDVRIPTLSDEAIQVELGRLVAMLRDGHTELWLAREGLGFRNFPFFLYDYDGELYVHIVNDGFKELLGAKVIALEGNPVGDVRAQVDAIIAADNSVERLLSTPVYIGVPEILFGLGLIASPDAATFTFEQNGRRSEVQVPALGEKDMTDGKWLRARDDSPAPLYLQNQDRYYWFEYLDDSQTMYVKYNRCQNQKDHPSIKTFAKELFKVFDESNAERLVLDVRNNRGGNYNKSKPLIEGIERRLERLGEGRLFVITGRETFSAGMVTTLQLKQRAGAVLVGEPGRSSPNGSDNFEWFHLPNSNLRVDYTNRVKMRAPEYEGFDVLPVDIAVGNGFEDYRTGRDRLLETVLAPRPDDVP